MSRDEYMINYGYSNADQLLHYTLVQSMSRILEPLVCLVIRSVNHHPFQVN
jgi:hypothetical protein